jgi:hypothetical protein
VRAQVTGYLQQQGYKEGAFVRKGQLLFQIDPRPFQAALDQAQGQLEQAKAMLANAQAVSYAPPTRCSVIEKLASALPWPECLVIIASQASHSLRLLVDLVLLRCHAPRSTNQNDGDHQILRVEYSNLELLDVVRSHSSKRLLLHVHPP